MSDTDVSPYDPYSHDDDTEIMTIVSMPEKKLERKVFHVKEPFQRLLTGRFPIGGEFMHWYTDRAIIREYHAFLISKITEWQRAVRKALNCLDGNAEELKAQFDMIENWAMNDVDKIKQGIRICTNLCVGVMSDELIRRGGVGGVDTNEKLYFIRRMVVSRKVTVVMQPQDTPCKFRIDTVYDGDWNGKESYGQIFLGTS